MVELVSILIILFLCWVTLATADASVAGLCALLGRARFKTVFLWGLLSLLIPVVAVAYGTLIEKNWYQVKEVTVGSAKLPESFDGFRIVQVSDIHLRSFAKRPESLRKAVEKINSLNADIVCFTGDLITMDVSEINDMYDILKDIKGPVFSVLGNHDYHIYAGGDGNVDEPARQAKVEALISCERELGWELLLNYNRYLYRAGGGIYIMGVENTSASEYFPSHGDLEAAMCGTDGRFCILLSHDPTHWDMEVVGKDIPLTLSGHTHATQFSLLGWCPGRYLFKQYRGLYTKGRQNLYVNAGLGETIFPARIGARPEITLITLKKSYNIN